MKKLIVILLLLTNILAFSQARYVNLTGAVFSKNANAALVGAKVYLVDSAGCVVDSANASSRAMYGSNIVTKSEYRFRIPYTPSVYTIEASYPSYVSGFAIIDLKTLHKREFTYKLPDIYLVREAKKLGEVTVTATTVKFYNKGDTLVYNADAFQLADGSMLDALIKQLPGVELKEDGRIFVNGKFVESLLLNGRDFMGDNRQLLLENLGAYTVKDVAVYDKMSEHEKFLDRNLGESQYVMDVRMKKEFLGTYILNIEAGFGTSDRYMGRVFGIRSSATSQVSIAGAINNVNDKRTPGQTSSWTPENMESGVHKEKLFRANYDFDSPDHRTWSFKGNTILKYSSLNDIIDTDETTFLPAGASYRYAFNSSRAKNLWLGTAARYNHTFSKVMLMSDLTVQYTDVRNKNSLVSATFNKQQIDVTRSMLEQLYDVATIEPGSIVNRNIQTDSTTNRTLSVDGGISSYIKIPHSSDDFGVEVRAKYTTEKPERFNDQVVNYGDDRKPAVRNAQYYKNHPLHNLNVLGRLSYSYFFLGGYFQPEYELSYEDKTKDSRLYMLEYLADNDIYGMLPDNYGQYYNPDNSYYGIHKTLKHSIMLRVAFSVGKFNFQLSPTIQPVHQSLNYTQGDRNIRKTRNSLLFGSFPTHITYGIGEYSGSYGMKYYKHSFDLELKTKGRTPDMTWLVDMPYTVDPLNIQTGADKLKNEQQLEALLTWKLQPKGSRMMESVKVSYSNVCNALVRGFRYDTSTGVRTVKSYNVNGNWDWRAENSLSIPVRKVMVSSNTALNYGHAADMIGRDTEPTPYRVRNLYLSEQLSLQYSPASWLSLTAKADFQWRKTTSREPDFSKISAITNNTGLTALVKLPSNFQISTDVTLYTRRGYGSPELNTTDCVWNARVLWSTNNKKWLFTIDGFDMLKQLSSVTYTVNNQGRTVTHMNVLPRYAMLHVQYRLNILPKRK